MSTVDLSGLAWRKGSRSGTHSNGACVEIALAGPLVAIRDSKNPTAALAFPSDTFIVFLNLNQHA